MPGRVQRVFDRYAARHLALTRPGPAMIDAAGHKIGQVDTIALHNDRLVVRGQARADHLALELGGRRRLASSRSLAGGQGFQLELPYDPGPAQLWFSLAGQSQALALPGFTPRQRALARLVLWPGFVLAGLTSLPAAWRWLRHHDLAARARVKKRLGLGAMVEERALDSAALPATPPLPLADPDAASVTLVLPVYQAFDLLPEVLDRIVRHTDLPWRLIVVEDASPDPQIRPFLRDWAAGRPEVVLLENPANLGFIGSVNRGLAEAAAQPDAAAVILLNSDAFVPAGWASRLVAPLLADPAVASVTPMSNDAELMSVPVICVRSQLGAGAVDAVDAVARRIDPDLADAPTGVGFCMALSPRFLQAVPALDTAFGRGYGEEVDWCQKTRALGGRHVCLTNLFVEHRGGASFGTEAKQDLIRRNGAVISARYPGFDAEVQRFIGNDPLLTARLALGLAWAGTLAGAVPVYLGHTMGGGAELYLRRRVNSDVRRLGAAVVLRVGGEYRWDITLYSAGGTTRGATNDAALMLRLLQLLPRRRVIYSCGVGDPDPVELPDLLLDLGAGQRLEALVHDYLMISPSYTLLDPAGVFRGVPQPGQEGRGHSQQRPDGRRVDLAGWQAAWHRLLQACDQISVFSPSSRDLLLTAYPDLAPRLKVLPHQGGIAQPRQEVRRGARPVIGVLGNIAPHKGAAVICALSRHLARSREADLVLIGNIDPNFNLAPPARVHGAYQPHQIAELAQRHGIGCWLIPSVCPETFSFTTHEALATGLPVICFDLGAQGETVGRAMAAGAPGAVLPLHEGQPDLAELVAAALRLTR